MNFGRQGFKPALLARIKYDFVFCYCLTISRYWNVSFEFSVQISLFTVQRSSLLNIDMRARKVFNLAALRTVHGRCHTKLDRDCITLGAEANSGEICRQVHSLDSQRSTAPVVMTHALLCICHDIYALLWHICSCKFTIWTLSCTFATAAKPCIATHFTCTRLHKVA